MSSFFVTQKQQNQLLQTEVFRVIYQVNTNISVTEAAPVAL